MLAFVSSGEVVPFAGSETRQIERFWRHIGYIGGNQDIEHYENGRQHRQSVHHLTYSVVQISVEIIINHIYDDKLFRTFLAKVFSKIGILKVTNFVSAGKYPLCPIR